ncbi:MAG: hypothetical protein NZM05_11940 [Chloroherpetonaceae bacterium]|nr:hypothetical protein [Chloroherpetonaceae bacterium]MCS7212525.1 hypothetical protein [Chloroherpetonaceae bacterium]
MIDTHKIYNALKANFSAEQAEALTNIISETILDFDRLVTKQELGELKEAIKELSEAQRRTEERLNALAEAQRRTEERVNELAEAQRRTEERLNELAEAQRRTEERLDKLAHEMTEMRREFYAEIKDIRQQLGGLSMAVGYGIEDRIMPYFYDLAEKDYGITLKSLDRRNYIYPDGRYDEVNIYAEGVKGDRVCLIIAECKAQPGKKDVDRFSDMLSRLRAATGLEVYPILIGYVFSPEVEMYVQTQYPEIRLMKTFEFELSYDARKKRRA